MNDVVNHKELVRALKVTKHIFDEHDIPFWLNYGTLLGAVREGKIISYDSDIDIGTWFSQTKKIYKLRDEFSKWGYEFTGTPYHFSLSIPKTNKSVMCIYSYIIFKDYVMPTNIINGFKDVLGCLLEPEHPTDNHFFYGNRNGFIYKLVEKLTAISYLIEKQKRRKLFTFVLGFVLHFKLYYRKKKVHMPLKYMNSFSTISFYGEEFKIPVNSDKYLTFIYGDWRTPVNSPDAHAQNWGINYNEVNKKYDIQRIKKRI